MDDDLYYKIKDALVIKAKEFWKTRDAGDYINDEYPDFEKLDDCMFEWGSEEFNHAIINIEDFNNLLQDLVVEHSYEKYFLHFTIDVIENLMESVNQAGDDEFNTNQYEQTKKAILNWYGQDYMTIIAKLESMGFIEYNSSILKNHDLFYHKTGFDHGYILGIYRARINRVVDQIDATCLSEAKILERAEMLVKWSKE